MMIRSKNGHNMKDKPFDLLICRVTDAQNRKRIFCPGSAGIGQTDFDLK
jgi:hypothetical protein